jgi:hypothetical protein
VDLSSPYKPLGLYDHQLIDAALWHLLPLVHCAPGHAKYPSQCSLRTCPFDCLFFGHPYSVLYIYWPRVRVSPYEKVLCVVKRTVQSIPMPQHPAAVFKERR